jgi:triacylglycerol lipase
MGQLTELLRSKIELPLELVALKPLTHIQRRAVFLPLLAALCVMTANSLPAKDAAHAVAHPNPVLLVHGFQDDAKKMQPMAHTLRRDGWTVFTPTLSPSGCQVGNEVLAQQLSDFIEANVPHDKRCDLVGFSMGAIVCRYYLQRLGGIARVDRFVAISAPEHGTWWAKTCPTELLRLPGVAQLRPGSAFLRDLNSDAQMLDRVRFTTIWTPLDLMILPAASSRMPVGSETKLWVPLHPLMVWLPSCHRAVAAGLIELR